MSHSERLLVLLAVHSPRGTVVSETDPVVVVVLLAVGEEAGTSNDRLRIPEGLGE